LLACVTLLAAVVPAHVRLRDPNTLAPLSWSSPGAISVVLSSKPPDSIADRSHETAIRNAIHAWNEVATSAVKLVENTSPAQRDRTDFQSFGLHQVLFDESDASGFFPTGSGIVAITPVTFTIGGSILDADILFNGAEFNFTTRGQLGSIDVQDVATHELGHFIGLDHTGVGGASMYPFVGPGDLLQRSLSEDDVNGATEIAPVGVSGSITGTVRRLADLRAVAAAHVSAVTSDGRSESATLTGADGKFRLSGLSVGEFRVSVNPLDGPVGEENVSVDHPVETDFGTLLGPVVPLASGQTFALGDVLVPDDVAFRLGDRADPLPVRAVAGEVRSGFLLGGFGLSAGTTLETSDPDVIVFGVVTGGSTISFSILTPSGAEPGHVDLIARRGAAVDLIPGAVEITPPDPTVASVAPTQGAHVGGTLVSILGSGFRSGAAVVLGDRVYREGAGLEVQNDTLMRVTTLATESGLRDVVVIDASGVEGRLAGGFRFTADPVVDTVFPRAGNSAGGTQVVIKGRDFDANVVVRIGGAIQPVVRVDDRTLRITTSAGASGATSLAVENPAVVPLATAFTYVSQPDPRVASVAPTSGLAGTRVTVTGTDFTPDTTVSFGLDPETGLGGAEATAIDFVSSTTLEVIVPSVAAGASAVMTMDRVTGQASVLPAAFTVTPAAKTSGGGGCHTAPVSAPPSVGRALEAGVWLMLLFAFALALRVQGRRAARIAA
jgi:hypothetical protein